MKHIEKTEFGPGKTPLYYTNVGLFSDPFLEDRLPNLEKFYSHPSTKYLNEYWNIDESDPKKFNNAFQELTNLWNKLDQNVPKYCSKERQLQNSWIDKIFEILGWTIELEETSQQHGISNFPDYALFRSVNDWKRSKDLTGNNKFKRAAAIADAKDWNVNLDGEGFSNKNPSFQIINYLKQTDKNWGILTNGKYWRIYSLRSESKHTTYYEIDLEKLLQTGDYQRFKYFFNFFRVEAFLQDPQLNDRCFLDFVFEDGQFYSERVEKNLQDRVYKVVSSICDGFIASKKVAPTDKELKEIYEYSMYYLFKLMFVLNCESKGLLEVNKQDDYYDFSLRKKCFEIKEQREQGKNWSQQPHTYNYIEDLFNLLKKGDERIGVHGFGDEPFEIGSSEFYSKHKIWDEFLNRALLDLACDQDEDGNLQFIDYKILSPDHIGSLFEGLLEFGLVRSSKKIELLNSKGERKSSGSYYTPDYMVDFIVKETLGPLSSERTPAEILKLRVIDPAMGSGHFLLGVVKFLESCIVSAQNGEKRVSGAIEFDKVRREVLKNCVFGVDINPLAAQLAKFSLWIYSSQKGDYLEPLADQLICGNSLIDSFVPHKVFPEIKNGEKFDAIVANPPYLGEKGNKAIFDVVKDSKLGKYHLGKMDYWYFFVHKFIELVKPEGEVGFIATDYWRHAEGAAHLRSALSKCNLHRYISFGDFKVFKTAKGQHNMALFFNLAKSKTGSVLAHFLKDSKRFDEVTVSTALLSGETSIFDVKKLNSSDGTFEEVMSSKDQSKSVITAMERLSDLKLGDVAMISQGFTPNPDKVNSRNIKKFSPAEIKTHDIKVGDEVFVISNSKRKELAVSSKEKALIVPYMPANSLENGMSVEHDGSNYLIYTTSETCPSESDLGLIKGHLKKYKKLMDERRETTQGRRSWHQLHWPKEQSFFEMPAIVSVRMTKEPVFAFTSGGIYFDLAVNMIRMRTKDETTALFYYLSSELVKTWLKYRGKHKGNQMQVDGAPLEKIPVPDFSKFRGNLTDKRKVLEFCYQWFGLSTEKDKAA